MALDSIFRLVLCSREDVSFIIICLNVLESIRQLFLLMLFTIYRLETPFKSDNVKALIKTSNCENIGPLFLEESFANCSICCAFLVFSDQPIT